MIRKGPLPLPVVDFSKPPLATSAWPSAPLPPDLRTSLPPCNTHPPPSMYFVMSCTSKSGDGTLAHPWHQQLIQFHSTLRQAHQWVLQANMCPHLQQASADRINDLSGGDATPVWPVLSSSLFPSSKLFMRLVVDLSGSVTLASSPSLSGDFAGDKVWDLKWTLILCPPPWYVQ